MLQLLTFLLEKLSLLYKFKLFEFSWWRGENRGRERHAQRCPPPTLRGGDLLEVPGSILLHYGIYLAEHKVAHLPALTNKTLILGCVSKCVTVRVDTLVDFAYGSKLLVNRIDEMKKNQALPNEDVALNLVGDVPHILPWNNCEHHVTHCRSGTATSRQTEKLLSFFFVASKDEEDDHKHDLSLYKRGDLLEVPRTLFTHFGIYLGDDRVAHLIPDVLPVFSKNKSAISKMVTNNRLLLGVVTKVASVRVDSVADFAYGSRILVNHMDKVCSEPPLDGEEVARRAEKLLGSVDYSLLWYNCEHYVMYCRYGMAISYQTCQFCTAVRKIVCSRTASYLTALCGVGLSLYLGCLTPLTALATLLVSFTIWMAA